MSTTSGQIADIVRDELVHQLQHRVTDLMHQNITHRATIVLLLDAERRKASSGPRGKQRRRIDDENDWSYACTFCTDRHSLRQPCRAVDRIFLPDVELAACREVELAALNAARSAGGRGPVSMADVRRRAAERLAPRVGVRPPVGAGLYPIGGPWSGDDD